MAGDSGKRRRSGAPRRGKGDDALRRRLRRLFVTVGFALALLLSVAAGWLFVVVPAERGAGEGKAHILTITAPLDAEALAARLEREGVLRHPGAVKLWLEVSGGKAIEPGVHVIRDDLTPRELVRRLRRDRASKVKVTFPEGFGALEISERLEASGVCPAAAFRSLAFDEATAKALGVEASSLEGYLYPATYEFPGNASAESVARAMVARFEKHWGQILARHPGALERAERELGMGRRALVTLASMVEKEAAVDDERPIVASVFVNRLRDPAFKPKLLQSDPTAVYGCKRMPERIPSCASFAGKATHAIVVDDANPWTTYRHEGLPPTPIASPGERALEAALAPATTPFLFFVAKGERRHAFAATYAEHQENVKRMPR